MEEQLFKREEGLFLVILPIFFEKVINLLIFCPAVFQKHLFHSKNADHLSRLVIHKNVFGQVTDLFLHASVFPEHLHPLFYKKAGKVKGKCHHPKQSPAE